MAGGDGTINEVVNGMAGSEVPLGILPAGTANVLANETRHPRKMERAAERVAQCVPERVALGLLATATGDSPRYFLLMAGAGLDADIVYTLNQRMKEVLGKVAYWIGGLSKFGQSLPEFTVEAEGQKFRTSFALLSRVRNYGGDLEIAPSISLLDDEIEMVLFEGATIDAVSQVHVGRPGAAGSRNARRDGPSHAQSAALGRGIRPDLCPSGWRMRRLASGKRGAGSERFDFAGAAGISKPPARTRRRRRMDNITHSLTGLVLSQAGLNRFYPRAGLLLVLSANVPDIDIVTAFRGSLSYFEHHRGITHTVAMAPVMALLPVLFVCAVSRSMRGWKAAWVLSIIGVASHLLLGLDQRVRHPLLDSVFRPLVPAGSQQPRSICGSGLCY